ncbi:unnamed protein product [Brassica oleracea var. botrytis]|uniref:(rape) hypothetical protein n=1 Tax=Brassica napus TaxID=3708 RepID=A0A816MAA8_BRANA|nr:unnamed protein product [Brassica napus]
MDLLESLDLAQSSSIPEQEHSPNGGNHHSADIT